MNDMQERFHQQHAQQQYSDNTASQKPPQKPKSGHSDDYIEFEEVR
jgi:hypothetical protein